MSFIPNSFQLPNAYVDKLLNLLKPEEVVVLLYIARRIYGFQGKSSDGIAWSQFVDGIRTQDGFQLDNGTGLSRTKVQRALDALIEFRLVIVVRPAVKSPPSKRRAAEYSLQLDYELVDRDAMEERALKVFRQGQKRTAAATEEKMVRSGFLNS